MLLAAIILIQISVFVVVIFMMQRIFNKNVVSATKQLDEINQDYTRKETEAVRQLEEAKREAQEIMDKASLEAEKTRMQAVKEAEMEKDRIVKQAHAQGEDMVRQADKTRQMLLAEMDERIEKEAIKKSCELIPSVLPDKFKKDIHSEWVKDLLTDGLNQVERLHIPKDVKEIKLATAFTLDEPTKQTIAKKLKSILGHDPILQEEVDTKIVAGIIITIGSLVLDGSFKNKIQEQIKSAKYTPR